jgi:L-tryptophan---pyruvate aminotransferase
VVAVFAWLRCEKEDVEDCATFLAGLNIVARAGEQFGGNARSTRDQVFDILVQRIASLIIE